MSLLRVKKEAQSRRLALRTTGALEACEVWELYMARHSCCVSSGTDRILIHFKSSVSFQKDSTVESAADLRWVARSGSPWQVLIFRPICFCPYIIRSVCFYYTYDLQMPGEKRFAICEISGDDC